MAYLKTEGGSIPSDILDLLQAHSENELVRWCLTFVANKEPVSYLRADPFPTEYVLRIYSKKFRTSQITNERVYGYGELLSALSATEIETITVHDIYSWKKSYRVFTDSGCAHLFAVLASFNDDRYFE